MEAHIMSNATVVKIQPEAPAPQPQRPAAGAPQPQPPVKPKASPVRRIIMGVVLLAALSAGAYYGYDYWTVGRFAVSTDDAYVKADMSVLGAKVTGYVDQVPFADNATVKAGDVVLKLDDVTISLLSMPPGPRSKPKRPRLRQLPSRRSRKHRLLSPHRLNLNPPRPPRSTPSRRKRAPASLSRATPVRSRPWMTPIASVQRPVPM